jgi:hypothetical protein
VYSLAAEPDASGIWVGTSAGLAFFDGVTWTDYTMANSGLPADVIDVLEIAPDGALWVGAFDVSLFPYDGGLARFDGTTWRTWTEENSNIPHEQIWSIEVDLDGNVWVGTASEGIGLLSQFGDGADTFTSSPLSWTATRGTWVTGDVLSLTFSDANYLWVDSVKSGPKKLVAGVTIDLQTHVASPSAMELHTDFISEGLMGVSVALKNVTTGKWDFMGVEQMVPNVNVDQTLSIPNPANYVEPVTGDILVGVSARASAAKHPFGVALGIDRIELTITE